MYEVLVTGDNEINFSPPDLLSEVSQNLRTIISTSKGTVPMFREFGLDNAIVDLPVNSALAKVQSDIIMAVKKFEPRIKLSSINFEGDHNGKLAVRIKFSLQDSI